MPEDRPAISGLRKVQLSDAAVASSPGGASSTPAPNPQAAKLLEGAKATASELLGEVAHLQRTLSTERESQEARFREEVAASRVLETERRDAKLAALEAKILADATQAAALLAEASAKLAPGPAGRAWSEEWLASESTAVAPSSYQRFGTVTQPNSAVALAPLLNRTGWFLRGDLESTIGQVQGTLARIVAQVPLKHLRIAVFDPKIEGRLGMFARLRGANPVTFAPPMSGKDELRSTLAAVIGLATANAEAISASGARDLGELWESNGMAQGEYTTLVVLNYPLGLDEETHATLVRLAETAASRGVSLIVQEDPKAKPGQGVDSRELLRYLTTLTRSPAGWESSVLPASVKVVDDGAPPKAIMDAVVSAAIEFSSSQFGPELSLGDFIDQLDLWSGTSIDSIDAIVGRAGLDPLTLSLRSENPPHPNMLVGGAVGQGKSTLLLDIIYSLAARYSPHELELILLDFKRGLEFKRFDADESGENWLPHVRVLSLESDKPFGLAVLDHVAAELARRSNIFKSSGANSVTEYRRVTGMRMSRLLLIIDEFQVLFDGNDQLTEDAVARLEELARQGRAFGIHMLLGTQSVSGISGLRLKGDTIFAQFPIRVSLKNTLLESQALFSRENTAAAELTYRGELIVNRNYGGDPIGSNVRGIAAFGSSGYLRELQGTLWAKDKDARRPIVFIGGRFAEWPTDRSPTADGAGGELPVWLGMPLEITDEPATVTFARDVDQAIAIVGRGEEESAATIGAILATTSVSLPPAARIVILDGDAVDSALGLQLDDARARGIEVTVVPSGGVSAYLIDALHPRLAAKVGPQTLVIGLGLQKIADLVDERPIDPKEEYGPGISGASVLRQLATHGATKSMFFVGCWANVRTLTEHLGYGHPGIGKYLLLTLGLDDLRAIVGPTATKVEGTPRVTLLDRASDAGERTVIPFVPVTTELLAGWRAR